MRVDVLGVGFDSLTLEQAVERGMELLHAPGAHYAVTPNPEIVEACRADAAVMDAVNGADLVLADGIGVIYAARLLKRPLPGRVTGIAFAQGLMAAMAQSGEGLFLLGAKPGYAQQAAQRLVQQYPGLRIVGTNDGYFKDDGSVVEKIRASGARAVFVCLGAPKQEFWMARNGPATGASLLVGLGGCLDVFSGNVRRAPVLFQRLGLEWLYRLCREPRRIGRMAKLPLFLIHAAAERGRGR